MCIQYTFYLVKKVVDNGIEMWYHIIKLRVIQHRRYKMIKYIKITKYMAGDSINKQIQDIINAGMMDKDTRLFFDRGNCLTMGDIKPLLAYFDIRSDNDINNVVLVPKDNFIKRFVKNGENFNNKK